jgi:hypothetical protein
MHVNLGENLIFLVSQPRAGSTLLQRILGSHPDSHTVSEPWIMLHLSYALKRQGYSAEYNAEWARHALDDFVLNLSEGQKTYIHALSKFASALYNDVLAKSGEKFFSGQNAQILLRHQRVAPNIPRSQVHFFIEKSSGSPSFHSR